MQHFVLDKMNKDMLFHFEGNSRQHYCISAFGLCIISNPGSHHFLLVLSKKQ